jgi:starch synthase
LESHHLDLSAQLSIKDRLIRRAVCIRPFGAMQFLGTNLDFARWRHEYHAGLLAARRIRAMEKRGLHFDVLHFHTQACAYASLNRMRRTPSIVSIDATAGLASLEAPSQLERWTYRPNVVHEGCVFRRAQAIIATSKWVAHDLVRSYPHCADKINVMPYPVKLDCFDVGWISARQQRAHSSPDLPITFLFIGGDFVRKGGLELLVAWRQGRFHPQARLVVVSEHRSRQQFASYCQMSRFDWIN